MYTAVAFVRIDRLVLGFVCTAVIDEPHLPLGILKVICLCGDILMRRESGFLFICRYRFPFFIQILKELSISYTARERRILLAGLHPAILSFSRVILAYSRLFGKSDSRSINKQKFGASSHAHL